ncbi:AMP-dependent synthetase/ligase [Halovenus sp. HT40]|uniref:AMP-dependent synthetase/ligase n=1 Tax=Halovenus sp. HT40 TaxID=3126691 RepID=UPI00300EC55C
MDWLQAEREYDDEVLGESTIPRMFFDAADRYAGIPCQLYKGGVYDRALVSEGVVEAAPAGEYAELSFPAVADIVRNLAGGFRELGVDEGDRVAIYADTRMEWAQADLGLLTAGAVVTTVYTESSPEQVRYLLTDPGATGVVVENEDLLSTLAEVEGETDVEFVVLLDDQTEEWDLDAELYTLGEVHEAGEAYDEETIEQWIDQQEWTDLASLVYTSGTTGDPKGVKLTHENWRSCLNQVRRRIGPRSDKPAEMPKLEPGKRSIAFLPLAHAFERSNHFQNFASGVTIGYAESTDTIGDDIETLEPEFAAAVPRVYERIYNGIREQASESDAKKRIFEWAVETAQQYDRADDPGLILEAKLAVADRLVFSSVREALGGNIEMFISGGGSLSEELARLYRAMGVTIIEGYGLTETAPGVSFNPPEDIHVGTMGPPLCEVDIDLDSEIVDERTREETPGEVGELLVKGPNVFEGYWEKPQQTDRAFDGEWFRTGDIVAREADDYLRFVDRRKNLLVLDTGKNVAPEPIEDDFSTSPRVDQIVVVGDDRKFVAAIIVPNFEALRSWAADEEIDLPEDPHAVVDDERVREWIAEEVDRVNTDLATHEQIKEFRLVSEEWTADNDLLTPSMKKKRRNIRDAYEEELADIYSEEEEQTGAMAAD